jgi:hypothetical protein
MSIGTLNNALGYRARRIIHYISAPSTDPLFEEVTITIRHLSADDVTDITRQLEALPNVREAAKVRDSGGDTAQQRGYCPEYCCPRLQI